MKWFLFLRRFGFVVLVLIPLAGMAGASLESPLPLEERCLVCESCGNHVEKTPRTAISAASASSLFDQEIMAVSADITSASLCPRPDRFFDARHRTVLQI